jgi:tRNA (guanine-N7-)-methyltransferase
MKRIKSFVKRNGRLSEVHKKNLLQREHYLCDQLPVLQHDFIGLEIGFGTGDSLLNIAKENPHQLWIGIEVYEKGVAQVIAQALENDLDNIILRVGDVCDVIHHEISKQSINHIRIFFPDPWHKAKHHKRRLINKDFLDKLYHILKPNGLCHIATDNQSYADACDEAIAEHSGFTNHDLLERPLTKFARKAIEKGIGITDIVIRKVEPLGCE